MRTPIVIVGVVILIIGIAALGYGAMNPTTSTTTNTSSSTTAVVPQTSRNIDANGIWSSGAEVLQKGEVVTGTFSISNYSSSQGPVFFYIQNESQFIAWGGCAPCTSPSLVNQTASSSGKWTFTFTAPYNNAFYFVFDNEIYNASAPATFVANGASITTSVLTTTSPNTTLDYAGVALIVLGAIVVGLGLIMKSPTKKPPAVEQAAATAPATTTGTSTKPT